MPYKTGLRNRVASAIVCVEIATQCETGMTDAKRERSLSVRVADDILESIDCFRRAQLALPSQTEALRVLVRLGFERWKAEQATADR